MISCAAVMLHSLFGAAWCMASLPERRDGQYICVRQAVLLRMKVWDFPVNLVAYLQLMLHGATQHPQT